MPETIASLAKRYVHLERGCHRPIILRLVKTLIARGNTPLEFGDLGCAPLRYVYDALGKTLESALFYEAVVPFFDDAPLIPDEVKFVALLRGVDLHRNISWAMATELEETVEACTTPSLVPCN